jgi:superfamily II DNA helicase RecQ
MEVWIITMRKNVVCRTQSDSSASCAMCLGFRHCGPGQQEHEKLEQMMLYGQSSSCRWKILHDYFNEPFPQERCGHCDNCMQPIEEQLGYCDQRSDVAIA